MTALTVDDNTRSLNLRTKLSVKSKAFAIIFYKNTVPLEYKSRFALEDVMIKSLVSSKIKHEALNEN